MLTVTHAARECLLSRLSHQKAPDDVAMRFKRREGGWRLCLDRAGSDDTAITHEGRNVLLLDTEVAKAMSKLHLDAEDSDSKTRLKLRRSAPE